MIKAEFPVDSLIPLFKRKQEEGCTMRFQFLQKDIGGNLKDDVGNEENGQSAVVLSASQIEPSFVSV